MKTRNKIKLLQFLVRSQGVFFLLLPMLVFILGAPFSAVAVTAIASFIPFILTYGFLHGNLKEKLRRISRSPVQALIEDSGLSQKDAQDAWNEVDNLLK